jgi:2-dehydropantoate 2-reductase
LRSDPEWRGRLRAAIEEACSVAAAEGVALSPDAEWEIIEAMPPLLTSSTARDIAAGVPSELDAITGAVVRAGRRLGVDTPILTQMFDQACRASSR